MTRCGVELHFDALGGVLSLGHIHLGTLPRSRLWQDVVELLDERGSVERVAAASAKAAEKSLLKASADATYVEAVRLLINVPLAARNADFGDALRQLDLQVQDRPSLIGIIAAVTNRLDSISRESPTRTDLSDLVSRALSAAFSNSVGDDLPGLFSASAEDVRLSFGKHSRNAGMSAICRSFFAALVGTSLSYWLDRTLGNHIGTSKTFSRVSERIDFDHALQAYVGETTRIVKEFSAGWVGKTARWSGRISSAEARTFGHVCLKKIVDELRAKRGDDD